MSESAARVRALLREWVGRRIEASAATWLDERLAQIASGGTERDLHITLGFIPRKLGKSDLALTDADLAAATEARRGWTPSDWSVDAAARILTLLTIPEGGPGAFAARFKQLRITADAAETVALYQGFPLYPEPAALEWEAGEGLRSNMKSVFEAIAHCNPYPAEAFDEHRWNHMVLKALFVGSRLAPMQGLDARANRELARIMRDFAHERWAAKRPAPFEIWRIVGPFATDDEAVADLIRAFEAQDAGAVDIDRKAAALGLSMSPASAAKEHLALADPSLKAAIADGALTWQTLSAEADAAAAARPAEPILPNAAPSTV